MSCVENDPEGEDKANLKTVKPGRDRPTPSTRIDMLPVMASTGEWNVCTHWTDHNLQ